MLMTGGSTFTGVSGTTYPTGLQANVGPADVRLAFINGWIELAQQPSGGPVNSGLITPSGLVRAYGPLSVGAIGDSLITRCGVGIDLNGGSAAPTAATVASSYTAISKAHWQTSFLLHGMLRSNYGWYVFEYLAGCGGATSTTICSTNPATGCLGAFLNNPYGLPDMCFILAGTNDPGNAIPYATTLANIKAAAQVLLGVGVIPILSTIPPQLFGPVQIMTVNQGIARLAQQLNVPFVDMYSAVVNPADGTWATGYNAPTDAIHFSALGAGVAGYAVNQGISAWIRNQNRLVTSIFDIGAGIAPNGYVITNAGNGAYTNGNYNSVPLTGGSGTGAKGSFIIVGGVVLFFAVTFGGSGYAVNDLLSVAAGSVGGTGAGFQVKVTALNTMQNLDPNLLSFTGTLNASSSYPNQWDAPATPSMSTILSPTTGIEIGGGKTPYRNSPTIVGGNGTPNYMGNAWQLKGDGVHVYGGGSYNVTTAPGDKMLLRYRLKWIPDQTAATKGDFRLIVWDGVSGNLAGIVNEGFLGYTTTCQIGGEPGYDAGDFFQIFTIRNAGGGKFANFLRLDLGNVSSIVSPANPNDSLTVANLELLNLTQLGLVTI